MFSFRSVVLERSMPAHSRKCLQPYIIKWAAFCETIGKFPMPRERRRLLASSRIIGSPFLFVTRTERHGRFLTRQYDPPTSNFRAIKRTNDASNGLRCPAGPFGNRKSVSGSLRFVAGHIFCTAYVTATSSSSSEAGAFFRSTRITSIAYPSHCDRGVSSVGEFFSCLHAKRQTSEKSVGNVGYCAAEPLRLIQRINRTLVTDQQGTCESSVLSGGDGPANQSAPE